MRRRPSKRSLKNTESFDLANATEQAIVEGPTVTMQNPIMDISLEKAAKQADTSKNTGKEESILRANADREEQNRPGLPANSPIVGADVFDRLSKTLDEQASLLAEEEKQKEQALRGQVMNSLRNFHTDRFTLGKSLSHYKSVFKSRRQWTRVAARIGASIDVSSRTVFRMIDDYESFLNGQPSATVDTRATHVEQLSSRERKEVRARLAIRAILDGIPVNQKAAVLAEILAEEAYQIWGKREKFSIDVIPRESRYTIDGRRKVTSEATKEVAA